VGAQFAAPGAGENNDVVVLAIERLRGERQRDRGKDDVVATGHP